MFYKLNDRHVRSRNCMLEDLHRPSGVIMCIIPEYS